MPVLCSAPDRWRDMVPHLHSFPSKHFPFSRPQIFASSLDHVPKPRLFFLNPVPNSPARFTHIPQGGCHVTATHSRCSGGSSRICLCHKYIQSGIKKDGEEGGKNCSSQIGFL